MNRIPTGEGACEKIRRYLDSYVASELLVETNHDVLRHLDTCPACAAEVQALTSLRARVKSAVKSQAAPPDLQVRIRERIHSRGRQSNAWPAAGWTRWAATAATLLVSAAVWWGTTRDRLPALTDGPAQNAYIQRISASLSAVLQVGLGDHVHCAIFRKYPKSAPTPEEMAQKLGPSYQGLLPLVKAAVPEGYRVIMAHQCTVSGRKFVHLTMEKDGELLSLVVARKQPGESLAGLSPATQTSGVSIYQSAAGRYQVAGFDAGDFLAYVVSDLHGSANLEVASTLAPAVHQFLMSVAA